MLARQIRRLKRSPDWDVREGKPTGRTVGRIYKDISAGGQWFWCLNDLYPSPAADRGYAPTRASGRVQARSRLTENRKAAARSLFVDN